MPVHLDELYHYDGVYRLTAADRGNLDLTNPENPVILSKNSAQDWTLDSTGNWTGFQDDTDGDGTAELVQTRQHNRVNETTTIGATTGTNWADPVHDRAGNMTSMPKPSNPANSITAKYDAWNRLVEVSDGGTLVARFRYDGEGRRILKIFDSNSPAAPNGLDTHEHVFLDDQQVIETREGSGAAPAQAETLQPKYQHVWSPRYIDSLILRDENTDTDGLCDDSRVYYLADANYNVTALVDTNGDVLERYLYSPYGEVTVLDADFTADADGVSDYGNTTLYTGREFDTTTGLLYYRARYYVAALGRFMSRDPIADLSTDANLYRYCGSDPLGRVDPSGRWFVCTGLAGGATFYVSLVGVPGAFPMGAGISLSFGYYGCFGHSPTLGWYIGCCAVGQIGFLLPGGVGVVVGITGGPSFMANFGGANAPRQGWGTMTGIAGGANLPGMGLTLTEISVDIATDGTVTVSIPKFGPGLGFYLAVRVSRACTACQPGIIAKLLACLTGVKRGIAAAVQAIKGYQGPPSDTAIVLTKQIQPLDSGDVPQDT